MNRNVKFTLPLTALLICLGLSWAGPNSSNTDFSGTWHMDPKRSQSPHYGNPLPVIMVVKQTPDLLSIETRQGRQRELLTYKLDGSESKSEPRQNGIVSWHARWDGGKLITETTRNVNGVPVVVKDIRTLALNGKEMTIERTLTVQHGYESGNNSSTATDVFIKAL